MPLGFSRIATLAYQLPAGGGGETSRTAIGVTAYNDAQIDTAQSKFGGASLYTVRATTDYLSLDNTGGELELGSGDFTIEFWHRTATLPGGGVYYFIYDSRETGGGTQMSIGLTGSNFFVYTAGGFRITSSSTISANTWYHVAVVKNGSTTTMYLDGTSVGSYSDSYTYTARDDIRLGANFNTANGCNGHTDEFRISSSARYTTSFTPSTTRFTNDADTLLLLHMDGTDGSTTFYDDIATPKASGGNLSSFYDGTNYYVTHTFTSSGTFTPSEALTVDALIVGGGGGGGSAWSGNLGCGGGGGGGQVNYQTSISASATGYTVTVGSGGSANNNGSDSSAFSYTAEGGGGGGGVSHNTGNSRTNAAGGGGGGYYTTGYSGGSGTYAGGNGATSPEVGGGGGGNGGVGENGNTDGSNYGGDGGIGVASTDIFSAGSTYYGGGGGGAVLFSSGTPGTGTHGGGNGGDGAQGQSATANTGSGGGGGGGISSAGGSGGSGVVVIRYAVT